jgi:Entner-Doudoroff aldolase
MATRSGTLREQTVDSITTIKLSAIVRTRDTEQARQAMHAAVRGGFRVVEFTLTTPNAFDLIEEFAQDSSLLVGAGTVLGIEDARRAARAGARFLVSPIADPEIIAEARRLDLASLPGIATPGEAVRAHHAGADFVKLFPAPHDVAFWVTQVLAPLPFLRIFPTAGVDEANFEAVLRAGAAGVGFVRSLFDPRDLAAGAWDQVEQRAARIHGRMERFTGSAR